jgi:hypothetical protein
MHETSRAARDLIGKAGDLEAGGEKLAGIGELFHLAVAMVAAGHYSAPNL